MKWFKRGPRKVSDDEFLALLRTMSQKEVAAKLRVGQPTVSRRAKKLMQRLEPEAPESYAEPLAAPARVYAPTVAQEALSFALMDARPDHVAWLWAQIHPLEQPHVDFERGLMQLVQNMAMPDALWYDVFAGKTQVGYASLRGIALDHSATAHVTFFDRKTKGREQAVMQFLAGLVEELGLQVVWSYTPEWRVGTTEFLQRMGWTPSGKLRRAFMSNAGLDDAVIHYVDRESLVSVEQPVNGADVTGGTQWQQPQQSSAES